MATLFRASLLRNSLGSSMATNSLRGVANKAYPDHIPLNSFEHAFLTVGTGLAALVNPKRGGESHKFFNFGQRNSPTVN